MYNKKRFISVKTKIIIATLTPVIICLSFVIYMYSLSLFKSINDAAKSEFLQIGQKYSFRFESKIDYAIDYLSIVSSILETQIESDRVDREALRNEIWSIFDDYGILDGSSIYFESDMYDGLDTEYIGSDYGTEKSGRICWYFYTLDNETLYLPEGLEDDIEFELPHYTEAKKANRPIYTDPATHEIDGKSIPMFTITFPVNNSDNEFIGAVTVDLFLEDIYTQLQSEKIYNTGYVVIANDRGSIIYSPRIEDIGRSREEAGLDYHLPVNNEAAVFLNAKSILNNKSTFISIDSIYIETLDSRFYISVAAPVDEINSGAQRLLVFLIILSIAIVAAIALLLYYMLSKIIMPMRSITDSLDKIAGGEYTARIEGDFSSEFAVVKESVNAMAESIEGYVNESKSSLDVLKNILNGLEAFVYVTVPETGVILFINDPMKKHFNIECDGVGELCYKILQAGMDDKCEFCPCFELDKSHDNVVVWEETNTLTNRTYRNTDCYIDWIGGIKAHLQHSVDITDMKKHMDDKINAERAALELKHEKEKMESAAKAKNEFFARMSHEIRTPMNAVMGMSEIILRKELSQDVYENALGIKSASANLLSIINDILDFSKIESGMMEIVETEYLLGSLINDVVSIIRIRLIDKPVHLTVYVDPKLPYQLIGDEIRIRQILINILSNAVKYTNEGFISLDVSGVINDNDVALNIDISDSGIGVKDEDMGKLFGDFVQIDTIKNRGVEGTGLGLSISRSLCRLMGGDITVKSEYGKGSTFAITLRQKIETYLPFVSTDNLADKSVLLYETRDLYKNSLIKSLESLGVKYKNVSSIPMLFEELSGYDYLFAASFAYGSISPVLSKLDNAPELVLLSDVTETTAPRGKRLLALPTYSLPIANALNDYDDDYGRNAVAGASFTATEAKVLVVDDIDANLKVCEGLLMPYEMQVTICSSGIKALELVLENRYDLVFMDHMMPEMDGLEVTRRIREMDGEYFASLPIIALTANAVSGVKEMFIQNGMSDFLSKPIETAKLDAILGKWIPKEKINTIADTGAQEEESEYVKMLRDVSELSVDKALIVVGNSPETYERIVKLSVRLLPENITRLDELINTDLPNYAIEIHGIKGVLNNIGAYKLGNEAFELERLSKDGEHEICKELHQAFIHNLNAFSKTMLTLLEKTRASDKPAGDATTIIEALPKLEEAMDFFDSMSALKLLEPINEYTFGQILDEHILNLTDSFERFDYDRALELIEELKGRLLE